MGAPIKDEFSDSNISRQRRYQLRRVAKGLCSNCGAVALDDMTRCAKCHKKLMRHVRRHQGKPARKRSNTKFIRATSASVPPEVKQ
jgi:predicted amidophosphoribosyltransferase